jgi:hypothetical protein
VVPGLALEEVVLAAPGAEVEAREPVVRVGRDVRVNDVEEDNDAAAVRLVDERLELLGRARARGDREGGGHVVAEGGVVGVLLRGSGAWAGGGWVAGGKRGGEEERACSSAGAKLK